MVWATLWAIFPLTHLVALVGGGVIFFPRFQSVDVKRGFLSSRELVMREDYLIFNVSLQRYERLRTRIQGDQNGRFFGHGQK
jgi:hypothetical protein